MRKNIIVFVCFSFAMLVGASQSTAQLWPGTEGIIIQNGQANSIIAKRLVLQYQSKKHTIKLETTLASGKSFFQKLSFVGKKHRLLRGSITFLQGKKITKRKFTVRLSKKRFTLKL